jgi:hypothetical protein
LRFIFKTAEEKVEDLMRSKSNKFRPYIPDFSLRVSEDVQILRIRRVHWLAAVRATYFENKQTANGGTPILNSDGEQIDLLTQELERADCVDPTLVPGNSNFGSGGVDGGIDGPTTGGFPRARTSSLAPTIGSDGGLSPSEQESLLNQHATAGKVAHVNRTSMDTPETSGRNTPTLSGQQRRQIFRTENVTPPSSSSGRSTEKNRSLT